MYTTSKMAVFFSEQYDNLINLTTTSTQPDRKHPTNCEGKNWPLHTVRNSTILFLVVTGKIKKIKWEYIILIGI
jgi:hypothetical protein